MKLAISGLSVLLVVGLIAFFRGGDASSSNILEPTQTNQVDEPENRPEAEEAPAASEPVASEPKVTAEELLNKLHIDKFKVIKASYGINLIMDGTYLGDVDPFQLEEDPETVVRDYLGSLEPLTGLSRDQIDVSVSQKKTYRHGLTRTRYRQKINGVPVASAFRLETDVIGTVLSVSLLLYDPDKVHPFAVSESQARDIARRAISEAKSIPHEQLIFAGVSTESRSVSVPLEGKAVASYQLANTGVGGELVPNPKWRVRNFVYGPAEISKIYEVQVDGVTGEATFPNKRMRFSADVCEPSGSAGGILPGEPPMKACEDQPFNFGYGSIPGFYQVNEVYQNGRCVGSADDCNAPRFKTARDTINGMSDWLEQNVDGCCAGVGNVDVYVGANTADAGSPYYTDLGQGGTIVFPDPDNNIPQLIPNRDTAEDPEVVAHETAHHVFAKLNVEFAHAYNNGDAYAASANEGLADALTALYRKSAGASDADAWTIGEDSFTYGASSTYLRDLREDRSFNTFNPDGAHHFNGRIYGNLIYKLSRAGNDAGKLAALIVATVGRADAELLNDNISGPHVYSVLAMLVAMSNAAAALGDQKLLEDLLSTTHAMGVTLGAPNNSTRSPVVIPTVRAINALRQLSNLAGLWGGLACIPECR